MGDSQFRRKWLRYEANLPVTVQIQKKNGKTVWKGKGTTQNLGGGGISFNIADFDENILENLSPDAFSIRLRIELPNALRPVRTEGDIVSIKKNTDETTTIAIQFKNISDKTERTIEDYVETHITHEVLSQAFMNAIRDQDEHR
jgi:c-di-GMP-binding flagellar brake protein YcgR